MLRINSNIIYHDNPSDMTLGRRLARYLSRYSWYDASSKLESVDRMVGEDDVSSVSPPTLDLAWEFFEHQMLPRRLEKDDSFRAGPDVSYERVEPGEIDERSKLYPIWKTPLRDMGDFGLGVGLYFSALLFFSVALLIAGCINIPNMISFWNANDLSNNTTGTIDYTLRSSAICTNTSWVPCPGCREDNDQYKDFVTDDRIAFAVDNDDDDDELAFILKNNCELPSGFGLVTLCSLGFVFIAMCVFMYFQHVKSIAFDNDQITSTDYSIEITNPPPKAKDPDEWKAFFETHFDGVLVKVCTIAVDNETLIKKLTLRRYLLLDLRNSLPRDLGIDEKKLEDLVGKANEPSSLKKLLCCAKSIDVIVRKIRALDKEIETLGKLDYDASGVFITFEREEHKQRVLNAMQAPLFRRGREDKELHSFKGVALNMTEPDEPSAIHWDDLEEGSLLRFCERFVSFVVSILLIVGGSFIILWMKGLGSTSISITIVVINQITPQLVRLISRYESHHNLGSYTGSVYLKVTAIRWANTAIVLWLLSPFTDVLRNGEYLLNNIRNIFIAEIVQRPILQLSDVMGHLKRHCFAPRALDQRRMNYQFMPPNYDIGERYTEITKVLFLTFFYGTLMPASFFYASAIFIMYYWMDKFCILRTWKQSPRVNAQISVVSMYVFLLTLVAYAVMAAYSIAQFPFDNACFDSSIPSNDYKGIFTIQTLKNDTFVVEIENNAQPYKFCNQDILGYSNITFPPFPRYQPEGEEWMTDSQEDLAIMFSWATIFILSMFSIAVFQILVRLKVLPLFFKIQKKIDQPTQVSFSEVLEIYGYIPQVSLPGFLYPQLICKINASHRELVGWVDPNNLDYHHHNMIYDVKKRGRGAFSTVKSWNLN